MNKGFVDRLAKAGLDLTPHQLDLFEGYRALIKEWNKRIDITAITEDREVDNKHFIDSLSVFRQVRIPSHARVMDMGSGGGFPGIPMKIVDPGLEMTLVDSLKKRVDFLQEVVSRLGLEEVRCIHARAEDFLQDPKERESFDLVVSRAVAPLPTLLEYCLPGVKIKGQFIAMKGPGGREEVYQADRAIQVLGGRLKEVDSFTWTEEGYQRSLVVIEKVKESPKKYPRGQGKARKSPL